MLRPDKLFTLVLSLLCLFHQPGNAEAFNIGWYHEMLVKQPVVTKSLTSCATNAFSDVLCQNLIKNAQESDEKQVEEKKLDKERLTHAAVTGLVWSGPVTHFWYKILFGKLVTFQDPILVLIGQIFLDAIIFSPITVSGYFALRSILEGSGLSGIREKLTTRLFTTVLGAWKFWPAVNLINFSIVPVPYRVLYMNVLSIFWSGYLTHVNSKKVVTSEEK